jgi:hypothetical protein
LSVEKSRFFIALPSILMYGVFGTLASFIIISVFMYLTLGFAMFKMEVRPQFDGWQQEQVQFPDTVVHPSSTSVLASLTGGLVVCCQQLLCCVLTVPSGPCCAVLGVCRIAWLWVRSLPQQTAWQHCRWALQPPNQPPNSYTALRDSASKHSLTACIIRALGQAASAKPSLQPLSGCVKRRESCSFASSMSR